ncbi:MAG: threonine/serine exporter family protein [Clostridium sp.]
MDYRALMDMAVLAGEIMLISGAEVYRIEDTVNRILKHSGVENTEVFVLATGIFATLSDPSIGAITIVKRVNKRSANLNRIYCVNNISRLFCNDELEVEDAKDALKKISVEIQYGPLKKSVGYVMTPTFFAVLFGGTIRDCVAAAIVGVVLALTEYWVSKLRFNDFCLNASAAFFITMTALFLRAVTFPMLNVDAVIISAIMPLVPGVTFTYAIRDTLNGDYSSGSARIVEAIVVALAVASGVGVGMLVFPLLGGVL